MSSFNQLFIPLKFLKEGKKNLEEPKAKSRISSIKLKQEERKGD